MKLNIQHVKIYEMQLKQYLMQNFTALCQYIRNKQSSPISDFWIHLKKLEKLEEKEKLKHKIS